MPWVKMSAVIFLGDSDYGNPLFKTHL